MLVIAKLVVAVQCAIAVDPFLDLHYVRIYDVCMRV